jgi:hypothetical protein
MNLVAEENAVAIVRLVSAKEKTGIDPLRVMLLHFGGSVALVIAGQIGKYRN